MLAIIYVTLVEQASAALAKHVSIGDDVPARVKHGGNHWDLLMPRRLSTFTASAAR